MPTLVKDIVGDVITLLSQVPGVATQLYASDRIRMHVQDAWLMEIQEMWWPDYMFYQSIPLDGTTGALTQDLKGSISYVDDYGDIASVYVGGRNRKLREFPQSLNPFSLNTGGQVWYMQPDYTVPHRPFKVYPPDSSGSVIVWARQRNDIPFSDNDKLYLDQLLLKYDACWMYCVDDGTVPAQVNKFQLLASNRRRMMKANFAQQPLELDPRFPTDMYISQSEDSGWFTLDQDPLA